MIVKSLRFLLPAGALLTGACFATRSDVRLLQSDIAAARAESARLDSVRASQLTTISSMLSTIQDTLRGTNTRLARWQADQLGDLRSLREQILLVQELTGQSQRNLQQFRADLEERNQAVATPAVPAAPGDTSRPAGPPAPGPNQLYQLSYDQWRRGSNKTAREGFLELLRLYPTSDLAPDAMYYVAETYAGEKNEGAADSVYTAVVTTYPRSPRAATALYKHGLALQRAGRTQEAKEALERVVREYARTDEAALAREALRTIR